MWIDPEAIKLFQADLGSDQGKSVCLSFCSMLCDRISTATDLLMKSDCLEDLERVCHNIKNNANYVGASALSSCAKKYELFCKEADTQNIKEHQDEFLNILQSTSSELHLFMEEQGQTSQ